MPEGAEQKYLSLVALAIASRNSTRSRLARAASVSKMMLHAQDKPHPIGSGSLDQYPGLPLVELPDLLMEVDGWTGFSGHLEHADGAEPRAPELLVHCHASILAQARNFG